jgi:hypothetical protein
MNTMEQRQLAELPALMEIVGSGFMQSGLFTSHRLDRGWVVGNSEVDRKSKIPDAKSPCSSQSRNGTAVVRSSGIGGSIFPAA